MIEFLAGCTEWEIEVLSLLGDSRLVIPAWRRYPRDTRERIIDLIL